MADSEQASKAQETSKHPLQSSRREAGRERKSREGDRRTPGPGNQATQRRLEGPVQPKLEVTRPDDAFEREADRVAQAVLDGDGPPPSISSLPADAAARATDPKAADDEKKEDEDAEPVQAQSEGGIAEDEEEDAEPVQAQTEGGIAEDDEEKEQATETAQAAGAGGRREVPGDVESTIQATRGGGEKLPRGERRFFESRMGRDLSDVRVHDGPRAGRAASSLGARAFTTGSDIYFAPGEYAPGTESGRRLLGHELAHTVQQGAAGPPGSAPVQRAEDDRDRSSGGGDEQAATGPDPGTLDPEAQEIRFDYIPVPGFKMQGHRETVYNQQAPLKRTASYDRGSPRQRDKWREHFSSHLDQTQTALEEKARKGPQGDDVDPNAQHVFQAPSKHGPTRYFLGDLPTIAHEMTLPSWDEDGEGHDFHVDHIVELQLAGWTGDRESWPNTIANMELLDASLNMDSGRNIRANIVDKAKAFTEANEEHSDAKPEDIKANYDLVFDRAVGNDTPDSAEPSDFWTPDQIKRGEQINDAVQVTDKGEVGGTDVVKLFYKPTGGQGRTFQWPSEQISDNAEGWLDPFVIVEKEFNPGPEHEDEDHFGVLRVNVDPESEDWETWDAPEEVPIKRIPGFPYWGYIDRSKVLRSLRYLRAKRGSPVEVDSFGLQAGRGIVVRGRVLPSLDLVGPIPFELADGVLTVSKTFSAGDLAVPPPFEITNSALTAEASTDVPLTLGGSLDLAIQEVGEGTLEGKIDSEGKIAADGSFEFQSDVFEEATIDVAYSQEAFSAEGTLTIPQGRVTGVQSATIEAGYSEEEGFSAAGEAQLDVPGVESAELSVEQSDEGLSIAGSAELAGDVPGIKGGSLEAELVQTPEGDSYKLTAHGTAEPDVPGVNTELDVSYDDGVFDASAHAGYERGMLSGSVDVGVTNRAIEEGEPAGEPSDDLTLYGGGSLTLQLAPWLEATAEVHFTPEGEVEVVGRVGLPDTVDLFDELSYENNLFTIGVDIPVVGVAVAGQRVGIFLTVSGGLDLEASLGPGQLRQMELQVTYNPEREEETEVSGDANLHVPAHAGLRLFIRGGLGAGIPVVSATAGIELGGQLGVEGALSASVGVDWTPANGLVIDAQGEAYAQPSFVFDITGYVDVSADLVLTTVDLYHQEWDLAGWEYGSGMRMGIEAPIHYEEGQPFDVSWDQVEFTYPDVDPDQVLEDVIDRIA